MISTQGIGSFSRGHGLALSTNRRVLLTTLASEELVGRKGNGTGKDDRLERSTKEIRGCRSLALLGWLRGRIQTKGTLSCHLFFIPLSLVCTHAVGRSAPHNRHYRRCRSLLDRHGHLVQVEEGRFGKTRYCCFIDQGRRRDVHIFIDSLAPGCSGRVLKSEHPLGRYPVQLGIVAMV